MDTVKNGIKVGSVVRYRKAWCREEERHLLHVVRENRLNPCTNEMTRWDIETINGVKYLGFMNPVETVDECMIEDTGLSIEDIIEK